MLFSRDRWRGKFLGLVSRAGLAYERAGQMELALDVYRRGVEADPLCEELYQRLMGCYRNQGKRAEADGVDRRCREVLSVTLGLRPDAQTESLRRQAATQV